MDASSDNAWKGWKSFRGVGVPRAFPHRTVVDWKPGRFFDNLLHDPSGHKEVTQ